MSNASYAYTITRTQREALALKREWVRHHLHAWAPIEVERPDPYAALNAEIDTFTAALAARQQEEREASRKGKAVAWVCTGMVKRNGKYEVQGTTRVLPMPPVITIISHRVKSATVVLKPQTTFTGSTKQAERTPF